MSRRTPARPLKKDADFTIKFISATSIFGAILWQFLARYYGSILVIFGSILVCLWLSFGSVINYIIYRFNIIQFTRYKLYNLPSFFRNNRQHITRLNQPGVMPT